jgi:hypothetical protein
MIFDWTETDVNRGFGPLPASPAFTRRHHDALAAGDASPGSFNSTSRGTRTASRLG